MKVDLFLKTYRTTHHLAQKEMACRLCITREHYARLEKGGHPSVKLLEKISSNFGVSVEDFFKRRNGDAIDVDLCEMFELAVMMNEKELKEIMSLMKKMRKK